MEQFKKATEINRTPIPAGHVIWCCFIQLIKRLSDHKEKIIGKYLYTLVCLSKHNPQGYSVSNESQMMWKHAVVYTSS